MKRSFALLAALFLLLRPLCDVLAADPAHGGRAADAYAAAEHTTGSADRLGEGAQCCAAIEDGAYAKPVEAAAVRAVGDSELAFAAPAWTAAGDAPDQNSDARHRPGVLFTRASSYYARSARIQR
jgi:hypothetical protein